uniref:rRNA N-glycosylase n=1 Tax=Tanacetum cinerariifolium TaxID=118510 RepID=A0A699IW19_TANCI|nr:hypothetical protein [Tanacetum cinerariifolium]
MMFKMNTHDYNLHGYTDNSGKLWELRISKDKVKRLRDSNSAGIGLTYLKLKGLKINRGSLVSTYNQLAQMRPNTEISNDVASLCLVLAEALRFNPIDTEFGIAALRKEKHVVLTDDEKDLPNSRDFSIFDKKNDDYSSSQCRMEKVVIAVAHLP